MRLFLPILFCFILAKGYSQVDSFLVNDAVFKVPNPDGWKIKTEVNGMCNDSNWNCILNYLTVKTDLKAQIVIKFVNKPFVMYKYPDQYADQEKSQNSFTDNEDTKEGWDCIIREYQPKNHVFDKRQESRIICATPLSPESSMHIGFFAEGEPDEISKLRQAYLLFLNSFFFENRLSLNRFLILNPGNAKSTFDSISTKAGVVHLFFAPDFTLNRSLFANNHPIIGAWAKLDKATEGYVIGKKSSNSHDLKIGVAVNEVLSLPSDTSTVIHSTEISVSAYEGTIKPLAYSQDIECSRSFRSSNGKQILLTFHADVTTENYLLISYYTRVVEEYANNISGLNRRKQAQ